MTKKCIDCNKDKPISEFYQCKTGINKGNYISYCKKCSKERSMKHGKRKPWTMKSQIRERMGVCGR